MSSWCCWRYVSVSPLVENAFSLLDFTLANLFNLACTAVGAQILQAQQYKRMGHQQRIYTDGNVFIGIGVLSSLEKANHRKEFKSDQKSCCWIKKKRKKENIYRSTLFINVDYKNIPIQLRGISMLCVLQTLLVRVVLVLPRLTNCPGGNNIHRRTMFVVVAFTRIQSASGII